MEFRTVKLTTETSFKEKKSKFIGISFPISNENDFAEKLDLIKKEHPKSNHFCHAYKLFQQPHHLTKQSDDGEPMNSAGKPILNQIEKLNLLNTAVVVVRYFGGTKLGVGGLIRAYKSAAELALEKQEIVVKENLILLTFKFKYENQKQVMDIIKRIDKNLITHTMKEEYHMNLKLKEKEYENILNALKKVNSVIFLNG
jgi:uncharacterized YigZ family protein